jgi:hypothetical protein
MNFLPDRFIYNVFLGTFIFIAVLCSRSFLFAEEYLPVLEYNTVLKLDKIVPARVVGLAQSPDGSVFVAGTGYVSDESDDLGTFVVKLDSSTKQIWSMVYASERDGSSNYVSGITADTSGYVYVLILENTAPAMIMKIGPNGGGPLKIVNLPVSPFEFSPSATGIAFDSKRQRIYATKDFLSRQTGLSYVQISAYDTDLNLQQAQVYDSGLSSVDCGFCPNAGTTSKGGVSTDNAGAVYVGGYETHPLITDRYIAIKYGPNLNSLQWATTQEAYIESICSHALPNGGMVLLGSEKEADESFSYVLRKVSAKGRFHSKVILPLELFTSTSTINCDLLGNTYVSGVSQKVHAPAIVKINLQGEIVWDTSVLETNTASSIDDLEVGLDNHLYVSGFLKESPQIYVSCYHQATSVGHKKPVNDSQGMEKKKK